MTATAATYTFAVPSWHPTRLNALLGCHWGTAARRKKSDRELVAAYAHKAGVPKATGKRRVGLNLTLAPKQRAGDPDAYHKSLLDAQTACGLLVDDSRQWCELEPVTCDRGETKAARITLTDLERDPAPSEVAQSEGAAAGHGLAAPGDGDDGDNERDEQERPQATQDASHDCPPKHDRGGGDTGGRLGGQGKN